MYELFRTGILGEEEGKILAVSNAFCWDSVFILCSLLTKIALSALWVGPGGVYVW